MTDVRDAALETGISLPLPHSPKTYNTKGSVGLKLRAGTAPKLTFGWKEPKYLDTL